MDDYVRISEEIEHRGGMLFRRFGARAGERAGYLVPNVDNPKYRSVKILGNTYREHRVVWLLTRGEWPKHTIDHINGNGLDNSPSNLRDVPQSINNKNKGMNRRNKTGRTGIRWREDRKRWIAQIQDRYNKNLYKSFIDFADAVVWRKDKEAENGYHENHGRVA